MSSTISDVQRFLSRRPERLVISSYRNWLECAANGRFFALDEIQERHIRILGSAGEFAFSKLTDLVFQLGKCATCPLRFLPQSSDNLCRDECLFLGLLSGAQHGDADLVYLSASGLACHANVSRICGAAGEYAIILKGQGEVLLPVPVEVVASLQFQFSRNVRATNQTIH